MTSEQSVSVAHLHRLTSGLHLTSLPYRLTPFKQCLPDGLVKTRSFTSLGGYNSQRKSFFDEAGGRKRAFTSPWETRSQGYHSRNNSEIVEPFSREPDYLSPNVDFVSTNDHCKLRWVDALNCWVPDKRPSQAFITFVNGAPVRQRALSPTNEDSIHAAQLSMSHDTYRAIPGVNTSNYLRHQSAKTLRGSDQERNNDEEKNSSLRRSHTITISKHITNKSRVSFLPHSRRQSRSTASSFPPNPPPSMTPSANSTRSCPIPFQRLNSGETTLPPVVTEVTNGEERLPTPPFFPKVVCEDVSEKSVSVIEMDRVSVVSSRGRNHSRQGSTSSIISDLNATPPSTHSQDLSEQKTTEPNQQRAITPVSHPRDVTLPSPKLFLSVPPPTNHSTTQENTPSSGRKMSKRGIIPKSTSVKPPSEPNKVIDTSHQRQRKQKKLENKDNSQQDKVINKPMNNHLYKNGATFSLDEEDSPTQNGFPEVELTEQVVSKLPTREITPVLATIEEKDSSTDLRNNSNVQEDVKLNSEKNSSTSIVKLNSEKNSSTSISSQHSLNKKTIVKKVKKDRNVEKTVTKKEKTPSPPISPAVLELSSNKSDSDSDIEEDLITSEIGPVKVNSTGLQVALPDMSLPSIPIKTTESKSKVKNQKMSLPDVGKKESKPRRRKHSLKHSVKLSSFEEEQKRQELGEERRKRQQLMLQRHKVKSNRRSSLLMDLVIKKEIDNAPRFEDYDFLAKYCIFDDGTYVTYKEAFDAIDTEKPWLSRPQVLTALKSLNTKLSEMEDAYQKQILELLGYDVSKGADLKLFSVIAALSRRISALDSWMKTIIGSLDFKNLEIKLYIWKTLWECNVDKDSNTISVDQLCVELRAGRVSEKHVQDVRQKLGHLTRLDLLDFLTYIPLFVMIHVAVVDNPLSDRREM